MSAFEEPMALWAVEGYDAETQVQVLALLAGRQVRLKKRKQMSHAQMQSRLGYFGAGGRAQTVAAHQGCREFRQIGNRGIHRACGAHFAALVVWLRLTLIIPSVRDIGVLPIGKHQAGASHTQAVEICFSEIADIQAEPLRLAAVLDHKLQQDKTFARITETGARIEMDVQLLVGLNEPEIAETGGMLQAHA